MELLYFSKSNMYPH